MRGEDRGLHLGWGIKNNQAVSSVYAEFPQQRGLQEVRGKSGCVGKERRERRGGEEMVGTGVVQ